MNRRSMPSWLAPGRLAGLIVVVGALIPLAPSAVAAELFRFVDEDGVVVITSTLPPRYASRGYTVIDARGRVVREVPRELTPIEVKRREAEAELRAARQEEAERQRLHDADLLRLYSSADEVELARDRRVEAIRASIASIRSSEERLREQQANFEREAAGFERAGRRVPEDLIESLRRIDVQLEERSRQIEAREQEEQEMRETFDRDRDRVRRLLGGTSRGQPEAP